MYSMYSNKKKKKAAKFVRSLQMVSLSMDLLNCVIHNSHAIPHAQHWRQLAKNLSNGAIHTATVHHCDIIVNLNHCEWAIIHTGMSNLTFHFDANRILAESLYDWNTYARMQSLAQYIHTHNQQSVFLWLGRFHFSVHLYIFIWAHSVRAIF